jgi:hypothetical protein
MSQKIIRFLWNIGMKLLALCSVITLSTAFHVHDIVAIAIAVKQHFRSSCVYLLHDNETGKHCFA